ncbi:unnamed protein product [Rodentolepis nana]|uniref:Uncharacterized protein n=1 Tax=Rodentolepis nana TaxID=102285 RepID=A0A3P7VDU6_RODNA|nr:unnamed protein product [Rodentolepis nana]
MLESVDSRGLPEIRTSDKQPPFKGGMILHGDKLGLVLEAYKRLQISVYVRPSKTMSDQFKNWTEPVFLPMVWFEEKAVAGADALQLLYESVYVKPERGRFLLLIIIGVVLGLLVIFMIALVAILLSIRRMEHRVGSGKTVRGNTSYDAKYTKVAMADVNESTIGI